MNEEKELLVQKCLTNPVLKLVIVEIVKLRSRNARFRLPLPHFSRSGLSDGAVKKSIDWLLRKGLLRSSIEGPYPQKSAHYELDSELYQSFEPVEAKPFGSIGNGILEPFETDRNRVRFEVISIPRHGVVGNEYGTPLPLDYAKMLRDALINHVANIEEMGTQAAERHRESREGLLYWGGRHGGVPGQWKPPAMVCDCQECAADYRALLGAWTNYAAHQKQERKTISAAVSELT